MQRANESKSFFFYPLLDTMCICTVPQLFPHLEPIFDWNVKQLFLYLSAEYATKSNVSKRARWASINSRSGVPIFGSEQCATNLIAGQNVCVCETAKRVSLSRG